jgi:hypothetical protein
VWSQRKEWRLRCWLLAGLVVKGCSKRRGGDSFLPKPLFAKQRSRCLRSCPHSRGRRSSRFRQTLSSSLLSPPLRDSSRQYSPGERPFRPLALTEGGVRTFATRNCDGSTDFNLFSVGWGRKQKRGDNESFRRLSQDNKKNDEKIREKGGKPSVPADLSVACLLWRGEDK